MLDRLARGWFWGWTVVLFAVAAVLAWKTAGHVGFDDSFITYVYARSFAEGNGLTWPGGLGLGTSTPFLAVLLGAISWATGVAVPIVGAWVGWLAVAATASGLVALGRREGWPWAGVAAGLLWMVTGTAQTLLGNEYLPAIAAVVWAFHERSRGRWFATGLLLALAAMFRAETGLAAPILAVLEIRRSDLAGSARRVAKIAAVAALLAAVWLVALWQIAGTVVPQTLGAKRAQAESRLKIWSPTLGLVRAVSEPQMTLPREKHAFWWPLAIAGALAIAARRRDLPRSAVALLAWGLAHLAFLAALRISYMPWYIAPLRFAQILLPAFAFEAPRALSRPLRFTWRVAAGAALAAVVVVAVRGDLAGLIERPRDLRRPTYEEVATYADRYPPGTRLAAWEVGFLGWASTRPVVDLLGLVSADASLDAVRQGDLRANLDGLRGDLLMVPMQSGSIVRATLGPPRSFLELYRLDRLRPQSGPPIAIYRRATLEPRGEVAIDLLADLAGKSAVRYHETGRLGMLAIALAPGEEVALPVPAGPRRPFSALLTSTRQTSRVLVRIDAGDLHRARPLPLDGNAWTSFDTIVPGTPNGATVTFACPPRPPRGCLIGQPYLGHPMPSSTPAEKRSDRPRGKRPHGPVWVP